VALLATGDELVAPGEIPGEDQIVSSVPFGLAGLVRRAGGLPQLLGIARDSLDSLDHHITRCRDADILVTIGGASVGEHDLVQAALVERGMTLDFWRIAMRPGKPLMYGRLDRQRVLGLPGNPVSAMLCGLVFLAPLVRALAGEADPLSRPTRARLARDVPANGPRAHYMRAVWEDRDGERLVRPLPDQDSSLVSVLAAAQCLAVIPANASALPAGSAVDVLELDF
jgi:molybdopterin molybdotransferase